MSSAERFDGPPSRRDVFAPLLALAQARTVARVDSGKLARDDGEFLLRALFDLEADGVGAFGAGRPADNEFYRAVADYLAARVGEIGVEAVLAPDSAAALARLEDGEGARVAHLLGLPAGASYGPRLDRAVMELVTHKEGSA